jgi:hypothetical protein
MQNQPPESYLRVNSAVPMSSSHVLICNRAGCAETVAIQFSNVDWRSIESVFTPKAADGAAERQQIAVAIGLMERLAGDQAGTWDDQPAGKGIFRGTRQLDCVAETNNTTVYLLLLERQGLLLRHTTRYPEHRGLMHLLAPHNTAVVAENDSGRRFAVDAYFHANGQAPEIVPLELWLRGYEPEDR